MTVGLPAPDHVAAGLHVGLELGVPQGQLEPPRLRRAECDLEVDLHVDVGGAGVVEAAASAEQLGDESAEHDELRAATVVVDHADERPLGSAARGSAAFSFVVHA